MKNGINEIILSVMGFAPLLHGNHQCTKDSVQALNLIRVVAHLTWGGGRDTFRMLYRTILRSKLDYGCIVYGTASYTNLRQVDSIHNSGLRPALGALCTSPVSNMYTQMTKPRVRYCWVPSHCGIEDNDIVDQLAKGALTMTETRWKLFTMQILNH